MDDQNLKDLEREQADNQLIGDAFQHLLDTYLSSRHRKKVDIVTKAFNFARQAHKGVRRLSGEPYIMHPIAVAQIACEEMGLGSTSICAALLHDVVEDTDYTVEDISNIFGAKVAQIVDGLTKISGGIFGDKARFATACTTCARWNRNRPTNNTRLRAKPCIFMHLSPTDWA